MRMAPFFPRPAYLYGNFIVWIISVYSKGYNDRSRRAEFRA